MVVPSRGRLGVAELPCRLVEVLVGEDGVGQPQLFQQRVGDPEPADLSKPGQPGRQGGTAPG